MEIFNTINKNDCCGCGSCYQSCTHNSINMVDEDNPTIKKRRVAIYARIGRFKSLMNTFQTTKDRFFNNCKDVNYELLKKDLNINDELNTFITSSDEFLNNALK